MYSKAKTIRKSGNYSPKGKHISNKNLYALYSIKGANGCQITLENGREKWHSGNFLSYVQRALKEFGSHESIEKGTKNHMAKIRRALKGKK
jgi:hypothetical protein